MYQLFIEGLQRLGRALMLPIAILPIAGLLLRLGDTDLLNIAIIHDAGQVIFANLALIFAIGIAVGFARDNNGTAGLAGAISASDSDGASGAWMASRNSAMSMAITNSVSGPSSASLSLTPSTISRWSSAINMRISFPMALYGNPITARPPAQHSPSSFARQPQGAYERHSLNGIWPLLASTVKIPLRSGESLIDTAM